MCYIHYLHDRSRNSSYCVTVALTAVSNSQGLEWKGIKSEIVHLQCRYIITIGLHTVLCSLYHLSYNILVVMLNMKSKLFHLKTSDSEPKLAFLRLSLSPEYPTKYNRQFLVLLLLFFVSNTSSRQFICAPMLK